MAAAVAARTTARLSLRSRQADQACLPLCRSPAPKGSLRSKGSKTQVMVMSVLAAPKIKICKPQPYKIYALPERKGLDSVQIELDHLSWINALSHNTSTRRKR